jgi:hypothetical protein
VKTKLLYLLIFGIGGCLHRYVDPPAPVEEGSFFVHVVKTSDESLPKLLSWYTGTTLSQGIVRRYNPALSQREVKIGDRVVIPVELVANTNPYGTAPQAGQGKAPNLLMGEVAPPPTSASPHNARSETSASSATDTLPALILETFGDEAGSETSEQTGIMTPPPAHHDDKMQQLRQEIADKQRELERLQAGEPIAIGDEDIPPPVLKEIEGS